MKAVSKLSREELLELLAGNPFVIGQFSEQNINDAKARVLRRKAEVAFKQYLAIDEKNRVPQTKSAKQMAAYFASRAEGEAFFKTYEKLWKKADSLEFGHLRKEEATHAAE